MFTFLNSSIKAEDCRDPVTHKLMSNPVTLGCNHTFDSDHLHKHVDEGGLYCPIDNRWIDPWKMRYNQGLAKRIQNFTQKNPQIFEGETLKPQNSSLTDLRWKIYRRNGGDPDVVVLEDSYPYEPYPRGVVLVERVAPSRFYTLERSLTAAAVFCGCCLFWSLIL